MNFATRYNPNKKVCSVMDSKDNVDRLSFVDSTQMVKRMIYEGQNLMEYRAKALSSGMYGIDDLANDESVPALPVYPVDPVVGDSLKQVYQDALDESTNSGQDVSEVVSESVVSSTDKVDAPSGE